MVNFQKFEINMPSNISNESASKEDSKCADGFILQRV